VAHRANRVSICKRTRFGEAGSREFAAKPGLGEADFVPHHVDANPDGASNLLGRKTAEVLHLDDFRGLRMLARQRVQRAIQVGQLHTVLGGARLHRHGGFPSNPPAIASAALRFARARVIHQNPPHDARGDRDEMSPIGKGRRRIPKDAKIRLVHQRRRLQGMTAPLVMEMPLGDAVELRVDQGQQFVGGGAVAGPGAPQQLCDLISAAFHFRILSCRGNRPRKCRKSST